jgi:hypothetical protein
MNSPKNVRINMTSKQISINGNTMKITDFTLNDAGVAAVFRNAEDNGEDLATFLENVISIGTKTLGAANAGAGVERLKDIIEAAKETMEQNSKKFDEDLVKSTTKLNEAVSSTIEKLTGEESPLATQVNELLENFAEQIEGLTADEDSPIRAGIKKQILDMSQKLLADFTSQSNLQKTELQKLLNPANEGSPFAVFSAQLQKVETAVKDLNDSMVAKTAAEIEGKKGTAKGRTFEKAVADIVSSIATGSGDDAEHTGDDLGLYDKMGDVVVTLRQGLTPVSRVAVEAKNKKLTIKAWQKEAAGSMKNRDAHGFIGVAKTIDQMPGGVQLVALDDMGRQLVVCFDPEANQSTEFLALVYQVVKMHTLTAQVNGGEINAQAMRLFVDQSLRQLEKFKRLISLADGIKTEAGKIMIESEDLWGELNRHLKSMSRELSGVEPLQLLGEGVVEELEDKSGDE